MPIQKTTLSGLRPDARSNAEQEHLKRLIESTPAFIELKRQVDELTKRFATPAERRRLERLEESRNLEKAHPAPLQQYRSRWSIDPKFIVRLEDGSIDWIASAVNEQLARSASR